MEKFILKAGKAVAKYRSTVHHFLEEKVQSSATNLILLLLSLFIVFMLLLSVILGAKPILDNYLVFMGLVVVMALVMIWVAVYYESNKYVETGRHNFKIIRLKKHRIRFELLNLDKQSKAQLIRLMKGLRVKEKINFTMGNKSGDSANHRMLFMLFDELIVGGVQEYTGERKRIFFSLLITSFLMNGEPLKENTLKSSFSAWRSDQEKIGSRNQRKFIRRLLEIE